MLQAPQRGAQTARLGFSVNFNRSIHRLLLNALFWRIPQGRPDHALMRAATAEGAIGWEFSTSDDDDLEILGRHDHRCCSANVHPVEQRD
jgi:hypothetical protein